MLLCRDSPACHILLGKLTIQMAGGQKYPPTYLFIFFFKGQVSTSHWMLDVCFCVECYTPILYEFT